MSSCGMWSGLRSQPLNLGGAMEGSLYQTSPFQSFSHGAGCVRCALLFRKYLSSTVIALASAFLHERLTKFTTSRFVLFNRSYHRYRISQNDPLRLFHSTPPKASPPPDDQDQNKQNSVLHSIKGLLSGHQHQSPQKPEIAKQRDDKGEDVQASFVSEARKYVFRENPTERWRRRKTLAEGTRSNAVDESKARSGRHSFGWSQEIGFSDKHRAHLAPPKQDIYQNYRRLDFEGSRMRSFVQVLTTPTADTPGTTLLLHFDNKRYLIGSLAEGTQRASVQMGAKLLKVSECFLTGRTEWSNTGGLIGMLLTLAESSASSFESSKEEALARARAKAKRLGVQDDPEKMKELEEEATKGMSSNTLSLFGPPNLNHTLATARRFVFRKGMPVNIHEILDDHSRQEGEDEWAPYWADDNIKVWPMSTSPSSSSAATQTNGTQTTNPRKRSIDQAFGQEPTTDDKSAKGLTSQERDQLTVKAVVSEMFDSSWRLDTLYETRIADVKMPATIFIRNSETNKVARYSGPLPGGETPLPDPDLKVLVRKPWPGALVESLPHTEPANEAISYIIRNHTQRGKFRPDQAKKLKVEQGKKWSLLAAGTSVENVDGETITPEMVLGEPKQGGGLAVVDLPDASYIDNLISRPEWHEPKVMAGVGAIIWMCGRGVASDSRIHGFMRQFSNLEHVVSSPDYCPNTIALDSATAATVRLHRIDPARYRIPVHDQTSHDGEQVYGGSDDFKTLRERQSLPDDKVHTAVRGQVIQLEPSMEFQNNQEVPPLSIAEVENEMSADVLGEAQRVRETIRADQQQEADWANSIPDKDAEVITLGTGSALPSKYRNVSATLVRIPSYGNILLDSGENTLGQLRRVFTAEELKQILRELRIISISHMHADHHLGTVSVIKAWYHEVHGGQPGPPVSSDDDMKSLLETQNRLAVIAEPAMQHWLFEYSSIEDYGFSRIAPLHLSYATPNQNIKSKLEWFVPQSEFAELSPAAKTERRSRSAVQPSLLGLQDIQCVAVKHCHGARAVSITLPSGFKVSYSGDCRPCKAFTQIGKGSTVCIHEATFDDELQGDAEAKNHSTTSEALSIAQAMGAKACVLTHFSQRYQKLPVLEHGNGSEAGAGKDVSTDLPLAESSEEEDQEDQDPIDTEAGPADDVAATFPDQETSNGAGQQYDLPSKKTTYKPLNLSTDDPVISTKARDSHEPPSGAAAVKLKLASDMKVAVAFDYMRVKVGEIGQLEKFTPALLKLFAEEDKTEKAVAEPPAKEGKKGKKEKRKSAEKGG